MKFTLCLVFTFVIFTSSHFTTAQQKDEAPTPGPGKQVAQTKTLKTSGGDEFSISYWLYLPKDYDKTKSDKKKASPLMLFLHGAGERGEKLSLVKKWGPPRLIEAGQHFPAIVVSPQCPNGKFWNVKQLKALLDSIEKDFNADSERIYVTGLSMGGYGSWSMLGAYPDHFAAAIPICGGGQPKNAKKFYKVPVWAFHGEDDRIVKVEKTKQMIEAMREAGGKPEMTIYKGVNHFSWKTTYENKKVFKWLFEQKRKSEQKKESKE